MVWRMRTSERSSPISEPVLSIGDTGLLDAYVSLVGGLSKSDILVGRGVSTDGLDSSKDGAANAWDVVE